MAESLKWLTLNVGPAVRVLAILLLAFVLARILKALTARLIHMAKGQTRVSQMREQQTRTMAGLVYSVGWAMILAVAILMALREFGFDLVPVEVGGRFG